MNPQFSARRSAAIRQELMDTVEATTRRSLSSRARGWIPTLGVLAAGMLAGGAVSAAALTVGSPISGDADGPFPGEPVVTPLGQVTSLEVSESQSVPLLGPPNDATHVRVTVTCLSAGLTTWGLDPGGNNPGIGCSEDDVGGDGAWYDFELTPSTNALHVTVDSGATSRISYVYLKLARTAWGVNDAGETYGVAIPGVGEADLVPATGQDANGNLIGGYVRAADMDAFGPDWPNQPTNPEEAIRWQEERAKKYPNGWDIPLYKSDGRTQIGTFHIINSG